MTPQLSAQGLQNHQRQQEWQLQQQNNGNRHQRQDRASPRQQYQNQSPSPVNYFYHQPSPSQQQHHSQQPLHYRTNFGKDFGYRPPSPTSPPATPTLLTQWSSQQGLERKRQLMLHRQQQFFTSPTLQNNGRNNTINSKQENDNVNHEEIPFDEREQNDKGQFRQQKETYQPRENRVNLSITTINSPNSNQRTMMPQALPLSPQQQARCPQRVKNMFERGGFNSNVNNRSGTSPRLSTTSPNAARDSNKIGIDNNSDDNNTSPIARMANNKNSQQRVIPRPAPPQLNMLYTSPVKTSVPKIALNQSPPEANYDHLNTPSTASNTTNSSNVDKNDDDFGFAFEGDRYDTKSEGDIHESMYEGYRLHPPRTSDPRTQLLLLESSTRPTPANATGGVQKRIFPVIGGPNMNTLAADEASALTDFFNDGQLSVEVSGQKLHQKDPKQIQQKHQERNANVPSSVRSKKRDRIHIMHYDTLASKYFSNLHSRSPSQQPHPYHKENESNVNSVPSTDTGSSDRDMDALAVAGVSRYIKESEMDKDKKIKQQQQHLKDNALQVQNGISLKATDDDSLFDFIETFTTVSSTGLTSDNNEQEAIAVVRDQDKEIQKQNASPRFQNEQRRQPYNYEPFPNRFISLLQAEDTDSASNTSIEGSDLPSDIQQRAHAAWKRGKSRVAAAAAAATAAAASTNETLSSPSLKTVSMPSLATSSSLTNLELLGEMLTSTSDGFDWNPTRTNSTFNTEEEGDCSVLLLQHNDEKETTTTANAKVGKTSELGCDHLAEGVIQNGHNESTFDTSTTASGAYSLNSTYTKSNESEVEDIIKDFFMMGHEESTKPGRKQLRYNARISEYVRQKQQQKEAESLIGTINEDATQESSLSPRLDGGQYTNQKGFTADDEETDAEAAESVHMGESIHVSDKKSNRTKSVSFRSEHEVVEIEEKKEEDTFAGVWNYVGNHLNAVTTALGLEGDSISAGSSPLPKPSSVPTASSRSAFSLVETPNIAESRIQESNNVCKQQQVFSPWNILTFASDVLLGPEPLSPCNNMSNQTNCSALPEPETFFVNNRGSSLPTLLEDDIRLVDLATQAAVSLHKINGHEFDPSTDIDIASDIKFSVVDLKLPLGLVFQENENGCWVTNVLPDGSAAWTKAIAAGDQLAAVDGLSAIDMTIDQVANLIRQTENNTVELTFLRYVGPFRPLAGAFVEEEGYEVMANKELSRLPRARSNSLDSPSEQYPALATESSTRSCMLIPKRFQRTYQDPQNVSFRFPRNSSSSVSSSWKDDHVSQRSSKPAVEGDGQKRTILPSFMRQNNNRNPEASTKLLVHQERLSDSSPKMKKGFTLFGHRRTGSTGSLN